MWSRFKALRNFNKSLLLILLFISIVLPLEIFNKISSGVEMSGEDYLKYALIWASFVFGFVFINFVDFIVRAMKGGSRQS